MNHKEFTTEWYGKKFKEPGYKYECVAIPKLYYRSVYDIELGSFGGSAKTGWSKLLSHPKLKRTKYKEGLYPPTGAIVFFNDSWGDDNHVEVANRFCNKDLLRTFGQNVRNSKKGLGVDAINPHWYDYKTVRGWFTLK